MATEVDASKLELPEADALFVTELPAPPPPPTGDIQTSGDNSIGFFAQSVGGSGGNGGNAISGTLGFGGTASVSAGATIGGEAGSGASAGNVTIVNTGASITTTEDSSAGIFAQSIGGSGGNGGGDVV